MRLKKRSGANTTELKENNGVPYLEYLSLNALPGFRNAFSMKEGGISPAPYGPMNLSFTVGDEPENVLENYRIFGDAIGIPPGSMVFSHQTHTTNVLRVGSGHLGMGILRERNFHDTDGLVTDEAGVCLVTSFADCVPLYFVDPSRRAIGLSHSGWRGTVGNICKNTVELMKKEFGTDPEDFFACIGPSIEGRCYEVGEDVAGPFREAYSPKELESILLPEKERPGKYFLDLTEANRINMENCGILPERISLPDLCTACNREALHSHRASKGRRGGMSAFLMITSREVSPQASS
ncbi:MAG: peptidoglycan editing factor PgeF [Lachnospiraceae bacterium]|nr:peptidoglycan editing factor PgeF [Lachnospiraceae bacterium]